MEERFEGVRTGILGSRSSPGTTQEAQSQPPLQGLPQLGRRQERLVLDEVLLRTERLSRAASPLEPPRRLKMTMTSP